MRSSFQGFQLMLLYHQWFNDIQIELNCWQSNNPAIDLSQSCRLFLYWGGFGSYGHLLCTDSTDSGGSSTEMGIGWLGGGWLSWILGLDRISYWVLICSHFCRDVAYEVIMMEGSFCCAFCWMTRVPSMDTSSHPHPHPHHHHHHHHHHHFRRDNALLILCTWSLGHTDDFENQVI